MPYFFQPYPYQCPKSPESVTAGLKWVRGPVKAAPGRHRGGH